MFPGILQRTIFYDLFRVFFLAFLALTGLVVMGGVVAEATQKGLGPGQILLAIPLFIPSMMPYTLPTTTLFAVCIVYGRLAADNEILAIKAAGIHMRHIIMPAVVLGLLTSALTLCFYLNVIPITHHILKNQFLKDVEEVLYGLLKKDGYIRHPGIDYEIYVKRVQGRKLIDAQFMRRNPQTKQFDVIARAKEAELRVDLAHKVILVYMRDCHVANAEGGVGGVFAEKLWPVDLPESFNAQSKTRASDMTWSELVARREQLRAEKDKIDQDLASTQMRINLGQGEPAYPEQIQHLRNEKKHRDQQLYSLDTEMHMRPAFALGCLCFVLVGCPIGIWFSKSDYLSAFMTCFLPIVTIYYPLMLCTVNFARAGKADPALVVWIADGILVLAAAVLFRKLVRS